MKASQDRERALPLKPGLGSPRCTCCPSPPLRGRQTSERGGLRTPPAPHPPVVPARGSPLAATPGLRLARAGTGGRWGGGGEQGRGVGKEDRREQNRTEAEGQCRVEPEGRNARAGHPCAWHRRAGARTHGGRGAAAASLNVTKGSHLSECECKPGRDGCVPPVQGGVPPRPSGSPRGAPGRAARGRGACWAPALPEAAGCTLGSLGQRGRPVGGFPEPSSPLALALQSPSH